MFESILTAVVLGAGGYLVRVLKVHEKSHELLRKANLNQIKSTLLHIHDGAHGRGVMSINEKQVFYDLYEVYIELGGNSFVVALKDEVDKY